MQRRLFLKCVLGPALLGSSCQKKPPTRAEVLRALVGEIVTPDLDALVRSSGRLFASAREWGEDPFAALRATREAWRGALVDWKRAHSFRSGPIVETNALLRSMYWPARPQAIESVLRGTSPIDGALVDALGVDAKGLYALEFLLFPLDENEGQVAERFRSVPGVGTPTSASEGARRRQLVAALAREIDANARAARERLGDGKAYAERLAVAGQQSVSRLMGQMVSTIEGSVLGRLMVVLDLGKTGQLKPQGFEGWPSGTSQLSALTELQAAARIYRGSGGLGLTHLVRVTAPAIDENVERAFVRAIDALKRVGAPLEHAFVSNRSGLEAALAATKTLEIALKVDVANALGVTLTFQSGDGD